MKKLMTFTISVLILLMYISSAIADNNNVVIKSKKKQQNKNNPSNPCESTGSFGQGLCAQQKMDTADKQLNIIYAKLLLKLPEVDGIEGGETETHPQKNLIESQKIWIKFRDTNCTFVGDISGGAPTWKHTYYGFCYAEMTKARTRELQKYLKELD